MAESASSMDESIILPEELRNLVTTSEYEELVETFGPFEGEHDGVKEEQYSADVQTSMQNPQVAIQNTQFQDPLLCSGDNTQQIAVQYSQFDATSVVLVPSMPSPTCAMPSTDEYPGPHNFEIQMDSRFAEKKWVFSHVMNKLFVTINAAVHLGFRCNPITPGLYVRAILVFCEAEAFQEPVVRCLHHKSLDHPVNADVDEKLLNYVLHIDHSKAIYDFDEVSGRFSVRVALDHPQAGTDWVTVAFKFMCKNSCISGMNRRPTEVIFTLENDSGAVLGRRKMKVRICSCPKRDKSKDEKGLELKQNQRMLEGKRSLPSNSEPQNQRGLKRTGDVFFQQTFLGKEQFLDVTLYAQAKLQRTLRVENREPNEKEATLLQKYECDLNHWLPPGN